MQRNAPKHPFGILAVMLAALWAGVTVWFVGQNALPYPYWDHWYNNVHVAVQANDGTLTFDDLIRFNHDDSEHRALYSMLASALTGMQAAHESLWALTFLVVAALVLAALHVRDTNAQQVWVLLPITLLILTWNQHANLLWSFGGMAWFSITLAFMLALASLNLFTVGWRGMALAGVFCFAATLGHGHGLVTWPAVFVALFFRGYRAPAHYVTWIALTAISATLYYLGAPENANPLANIDPLKMTTFILSFIASPVLPPPLNAFPALIVAAVVLGVALFGLNLFLLLRQNTPLAKLTTWVALALFTLGLAGLASLKRGAGLWEGAASRYVSGGVLFWVALVGICALAIWQFSGKQSRLIRAAVWTNMIAIVAIIGLQLVSTRLVDQQRPPSLISASLERSDQVTACYWSYLITADPGCLATVDPIGEAPVAAQLPDLFERRLSVFADYDGVNPLESLLPSLYQPGDKVIISAAHNHQHVREVAYLDWEANGPRPLPSNQLFRLINEPPTSEAVASNARMAANEAALDQFAAFTNLAERVWVLRGHDETNFDAAFMDRLNETHAPIPLEGGHWLSTVYQDITLYQRISTPQYRFDDALTLQGWAYPGDVNVRACDLATVETLWLAEAALSEDVSLALVLADPSGVGVARTDEAPGGYSTRLWPPDEHFFAQTTLAIPCDLEPGAYNLLLGIYQPGTGEALPVTTADGNPASDLIYLTTLTVLE